MCVVVEGKMSLLLDERSPDQAAVAALAAARRPHACGVSRPCDSEPAAPTPLRKRLCSEATCVQEPARVRATAGGFQNCRRAKPVAEPFEARIFRLLKLLPVDLRRRILAERFTQPQRLALERWALAHHKAAASGNSASAPDTSTAKTGCPCSWSTTPMKITTTSTNPSALRSLASDAIRQRGGHRESRSGTPGIASHRDKGKLRYYASVSCGPFRVFSRNTNDVTLALRFRDCLLSIQRRYDAADRVGCSTSCPADVGRNFRNAIVQESEALGLGEYGEMGLRFVVTIPAKFWVGKLLQSPRLPVSPAGLDTGVHVWRRFYEARSMVHCGHTNRHTSLATRHSFEELKDAWLKLRATYIDIWAEAGHNRQRVASILDARTRDQSHRRITFGKRDVPQHAGVDGIENRIDSLLRRWRKRLSVQQRCQRIVKKSVAIV